MVSQAMALDDPVSFRSLLADCHMQSIQIEHIFNAGYTTIALLAHGIHDESKMEEFVEHLSLIPEGESFQIFSPQSADSDEFSKSALPNVYYLAVIFLQKLHQHKLHRCACPLQMSKLSNRSSVRIILVNCYCP